MGKALEAYMRKNTSGDAPVDLYIDGDLSQLDSVAVHGMQTFVDQGCTTCHSGPMLTDQSFHNVNFPSLPGASPDPGRADARAVLANNAFNLAGPYADPNTGALPPDLSDSAVFGAFRTPSLRNVALTQPYGHDGAVATLDDVLAIHAPQASADERSAIIAFLQSLSGEKPYRPWSNWPRPQ